MFFHTFFNCCCTFASLRRSVVSWAMLFMWPQLYDRPLTDHAQSSYRVSADGSFLVTLASGMELSLSTEPLLPGGTGGGVSPTASRCNISLPGDHAPSLIEWRQRKEQSKTNYSTYERRLRVKHLTPEYSSINSENPVKWRASQTQRSLASKITMESVECPTAIKHPVETSVNGSNCITTSVVLNCVIWPLHSINNDKEMSLLSAVCPQLFNGS